MKRCIVIFFDTNILLYFTINQDQKKLELSKNYIYEALKEEKFFISPMILNEYIFILAKYKILNHHQDKIDFFYQFVDGNIDKEIILDAYKLCQKIDFCKNINDLIHLLIAQRYCKKLLTFDSDFKRFQKYSDIKIEIIK